METKKKPTGRQTASSFGWGAAKWIVAGIALVAVVGLTYAALNRPTPPPADAPAGASMRSSDLLFRVQRDTLTVSALTNGVVMTKRTIPIINDARASLKVIYVVANGTEVKKGDLLVELDATELVEKRNKQEIDVKNSEDQVYSVQTDIELQLTKNETDELAAENSLKIAQIDWSIYNDGDWPKAKADAVARVTEAEGQLFLAQEELKQSENNLKLTKDLYAKNFETLDQLERDQLAVERSRLSVKNREIALDSARQQLEILNKYTYLKQSTQYETQLAQMAANLAQEKLRGARELNKYRSNLERAQTELENARELLRTLTDQVSNTKVFAPQDGMVVYFKKRGRGRDSGQDQDLEVGANINPKQRMMDLPDFSAWAIDTMVPESMIQRIREGQRAFIRLDAFPSLVMEGQVAEIGVLPDSSEWFRQVPQYAVKIDVLNSNPRLLKPGMSAKSEVIIEELEDVLVVPIHAVHTHQGRTVVWVAGELGPEIREIAPGVNNYTMVEVRSGLSEGEVVILDQPVSAGSATGQRPHSMASAEQRADAQSSVPLMEDRPARGGPGRGGRGGGRRGGGRGRGDGGGGIPGDGGVLESPPGSASDPPAADDGALDERSGSSGRR